MEQVSLELVPSTEASFQPVCRACLAADLKMYDLQTKELYKDFFDLTGLQLSIGDQCGICYICCTLLKKATSFRNKCLSSHKLLSNHVLTLDFMKQKHLLSRKLLERTNINTLNISDISSHKHHIDEIKEENPDSENLSNIDKKCYILNADSTCNTNEEMISNKHSNNITEKENSRARSLSSKAKRHNCFNMKNLNSTLNVTKTKTNDYTFKYTGKTKNSDLLDKEDELTDSDDDMKPLSIYTNTVQNVNNKTENTKNKNVIGEENNTAILKTDTKSLKWREIYDAKSKISKDTVKCRINKSGRSSYAMRTKAAMEKFEKTYNCTVITLTEKEQIDVVKARTENKKCIYKCEDCYIGFSNESKLISHRKIHDPAISGKLECEVCHMRFKTKLQYTRHSTNHRYKYICRECGFVCYYRSVAKNHYGTHAGVRYECQYCKRLFSKYASRTNHVRIKHGVARCEVCYARLSDGGLALHQALAHKKVSLKCLPQTYNCSSCERLFNDSEALKRHLKSPDQDVCDTSLRPCTRCGECFNMEDEELFNSHIETHGAIKGKKIRRKQEDSLIESKHDRDVCDGQFGAKKRDRRKLMCEICASDNFKSITALRIHQRIHSGEKPFQCPSCPKTFRLKHTLQWHIRTHTGDRPYACAECPKAFKTNTARARHRLVHTNERRHICELCGKAFQTSTNVKLHVRTVHMRIPMPPRLRNRKKQEIIL